MKMPARLPNQRLRQAGLHQLNHLPPSTQQSKPRTLILSQKNHESRTMKNLRQIATEAMMLLVRLQELLAVLLAARRIPGRETTVKKRTGSRLFGTGLCLVDRR